MQRMWLEFTKHQIIHLKLNIPIWFELLLRWTGYPIVFNINWENFILRRNDIRKLSMYLQFIIQQYLFYEKNFTLINGFNKRIC